MSIHKNLFQDCKDQLGSQRQGRHSLRQKIYWENVFACMP